MIKNLSRKGLVIGSIAALTSSMLTGAPAAFATTTSNNDPIVSTSYVGTGTTIIEGTAFDVANAVGSNYEYYSQTSQGVWEFTAVEYERYTICTSYFVNNAAPDTCATSVTEYHTKSWGTTGSHQEDNADGDVITNEVSASVNTDIQWKTSDANGLVAYNQTSAKFYLDSAISEDTTITFTPWLAADPDQQSVGSFDASRGDVAGAGFAVKFLNNTGTILTAALTGTPTTSGNPSDLVRQVLSTTVTAPTGVNLEQMSDDLIVALYKSSYEDSRVDLDADGVIENGTFGTGYYTARVLGDLDEPLNGIVDDTTAYTALSGQTIVGQISTDTALEGIEFVEVASANEQTDRDIRAGVKSFDISTQLLTADGSDNGSDQDKYKKSGVSVKFNVKLGSVTTGSVITANGTTVTTGGIDVVATTDANGVAKIAIVSNTGTSGDDIDVSATVLTQDGTSAAWHCGSRNWEWVSVVADELWGTHQVNYNNYYLGTVENQNVSLEFHVADNFGQLLASGTDSYRVKVTSSDSALEVYGTVVNGKATVQFAEQEVTGTDYQLYATIEKRAAGETSWVDGVNADTTYVKVNHMNTVGSVSAVLNNSSTDVSYDDFISLNWKLIDSENTLLSEPDDNLENHVQGYVVDSNNVPLVGVPVTVSASGVQLTDDDVYTVGSITTYTNEYGFYKAEFFTHKAGDNLFTVTSGGKSATVTAVVSNPTTLHADDVLTVNAPAAVQAGTVTPVRVQLVDKYGNGIDKATVNLGLVGEGYLSNYKVETDKGAASVVLINGVNDTSKAYISAATEHAVWDSGQVNPLDVSPECYRLQNFVNKSFTQAVTTGSYATVKASSVKGRLNVVVDNSRNETVRVFVDGKLAKKVVANSGKFTVKVNGLKKGKHKVTVTSDYQNLVTSKSVTIK